MTVLGIKNGKMKSHYLQCDKEEGRTADNKMSPLQVLKEYKAMVRQGQQI